MRPADVSALQRALSRLDRPHDVLVFSPTVDMEGNGISEFTPISRLWPGLPIRTATRGQWDLDHQKPDDVQRASLGVICNTFMCSTDPMVWLEHLSSAVPLLVIQDLAVCDRGPGRHCDVKSGDVARYSISSHGIYGLTDPDLSVFDLSTCGRPLLYVERYEDGQVVKFVAVLRMR